MTKSPANTPALAIPCRLPDNPTSEQLRDIAYATTEAVKRRMRARVCPAEWLEIGWDFLFPEDMARH